MRREFVPFHEPIIREELDALPDRDASKLVAVMEHYQACGSGNPKPTLVKDYGRGIKMLRHESPTYQGRCLFYVTDDVPGSQKMVILKVYKKESDEVPQRVLDTALDRMRRHREEG